MLVLILRSAHGWVLEQARRSRARVSKDEDEAALVALLLRDASQRAEAVEWSGDCPRCDAPQQEGAQGLGQKRKCTERQSKAPPSRRGFTLPSVHRRSMRHRSISTSTPGRDLLISTPGSRTRRRSSMITSRSRTPLPTVTSRSRCTQFLLHSGPMQSSLQIRSALAGSESAADAAIASAMART
jgi:hypothetical protein